ncbi:molybdopterin-guanine dinucleotide biosynthesis protein B [Salinithrix halophila]|uniref:Molybdopterin-guanine dinucleotide biosynthesis protein B n=1 Tax=Salinithrix halophila TaxID=1485204 RepID=A0ABV8JIW6_9BACL
MLQIVGHANSGKTTLITALINHLTGWGYQIGTVKHHAKDLEMDVPGKDSWLHRQAGASPVTLITGNQAAVFYPTPPSLDLLLEHYQETDLVLVEGFKRAPFPKWAVLKDGEDPSWAKELVGLRAVVSPKKTKGWPVPSYRLNETKAMAEAVRRFINENG